MQAQIFVGFEYLGQGPNRSTTEALIATNGRLVQKQSEKQDLKSAFELAQLAIVSLVSNAEVQGPGWTNEVGLFLGWQQLLCFFSYLAHVSTSPNNGHLGST